MTDYKRWNLLISGLMSTFLLWSGDRVRAENTAVIVGVGHYPNFPSADLKGIDKDVSRMEVVLRTKGFTQIIKLFDQTATKNNVIGAFQKANSSLKKEDQFCYYQSSHGTSNHRLVLSDTRSSGENTLSVSEIKNLISKVVTPHRTLILDACFCGGFKSRGEGINKFHAFPQSKYQERLDHVVRQTATETTTIYGEDYVFFGASSPNEASLILTIGGEPCSVFTYFLVMELSREKGEIWNRIVQPIISDVIQATEGNQTPVFNTRYLSERVFTALSENNFSNTMMPIENLGQLYNISHEESSTLSLRGEMSHDQNNLSAFPPGTEVKLSLFNSRPGYLFMINRDEEDRAQMIGWDRTDLDVSTAETMVKGSFLNDLGTIEFGKGTLKITTDARDGFERWKAFFFTQRSTALEFAQMWLNLNKDNKNKVIRARLRNSKPSLVSGVKVALDSLYTAEISYRVTKATK